MGKENTKTITVNKKAFHDYFVEESVEAGIELTGTEVKSIRRGGVNLKDAWCAIEDGELIVKGMHISPYEQGNIFNREPRRERRLLLHKQKAVRQARGHGGQIGQTGCGARAQGKQPLSRQTG